MKQEVGMIRFILMFLIANVGLIAPFIVIGFIFAFMIIRAIGSD